VTDEALDGLSALLLGWVKLAHAAARRRSGFAFVEAADLADLWRDVVHERAPVAVADPASSQS
jgi:hypothetical protein